MSSKGSGNVRTVFVFTEIPRHIEFRAGDLPILEEGTIVEMKLTIKNPRDPTKVRLVEGPHKVVRSILKYETGRASLGGLTQYLEWKSVDS
jgi:hypothetical protein